MGGHAVQRELGRLGWADRDNATRNNVARYHQCPVCSNSWMSGCIHTLSRQPARGGSSCEHRHQRHAIHPYDWPARTPPSSLTLALS